MAKVCINGCGLLVDADGNLGVDTGSAVWSFTCPETKGGKIYCSAADGHLHTDPPVIVQSGVVTGGSVTTIPLPQNTTVLVGNSVAAIQNPSTCWPAQVLVTSEFDFDVTIPPGGGVSVDSDGDRNVSYSNTGSRTANNNGWQMSNTRRFSLTPGQLLNLNIPLEMRGRNVGGISVSRIQWRNTWIVVAGPSS